MQRRTGGRQFKWIGCPGKVLLSASTGRAEHVSSLLFRTPDEPFLDLGVDFMEPLFGTFGPLLKSPSFGLQLCNPIFRRPKLLRQLLSLIECIPTIFFGDAGRFVEEFKIV